MKSYVEQRLGIAVLTLIGMSIVIFLLLRLAPAYIVVIWRHALKNSILPVVTVIGIEFAFLIGGLVVTETVFNLPGVARFLVQAILWRDYPIVQTLVMFIAIVVILSNLLVDLLYGVLDPRVRYG